MEKYRLFDKIVKTKWYSFFRAENTESREKVVVKKLHRETTWEEVLRNKNISLMNTSKVQEIARIKEIVKDQTSFYCIFENLDLNLEDVIAGELQKEDIFKISRLLIQTILHLNEHKTIPREIRPSSLFVSSTYHTLKLAHIEAFANRDLTKLDLVELQDLRYSPPEVVLTSKDIDERSMIFAVGLLISELILGKPLLSANTKMNYIYQMCKLFPQEGIEQQQGNQQSRAKQGKEEQRFEHIMGEYNFSNEFIALLRQMLKIDRNERMAIGQILEAFDLITASEETFIHQNQLKNIEASQTIKPNINQAPINSEILEVQIDFDFQNKPTLSPAPTIKIYHSLLPVERNVDDDAVQPIIIKKSSKPFENSNSMPIPIGKDVNKMSRTTKNQTLSTIRKPQLTNYALNEGTNLGVKLGFQPTLFSENDNDF